METENVLPSDAAPGPATASLTSGTFSTPVGDVRFVMCELDVRLTGKVKCRDTEICVDFFMSPGDKDEPQDWHRVSHRGAAMIEKPEGMPAVAIKLCVNAVRDGWIAYARSRPEILQEAYRDNARRRLRHIEGERDHYRTLAEAKEKVAEIFRKVIASEDPAKAWGELNKADASWMDRFGFYR